MPYPQRLQNFAVFADGKGYVGLAPELNLPKVTSKTEEYRAGGMDTPVEVITGTEKLECSFTLAEYNAAVMALWASPPARRRSSASAGPCRGRARTRKRSLPRSAADQRAGSGHVESGRSGHAQVVDRCDLLQAQRQRHGCDRDRRP